MIRYTGSDASSTVAEAQHPGEWASPSRMSDSAATPVLRFGWLGITLIVGFWTLWGLLMGTSLIVSPLRQEVQEPFHLVAFSLLGAYTWAALTLPLFSFTQKLELDSGRKWIKYLGLIALGILLAAVVSVMLPFVAAFLLDEFSTGRFAGRSGYWTVARYRLTHDLLASLLVLTAAVARYYFLRSQVRQEEAARLRAQLSESRLQVLRTQLNPHFLFNTLNAVAALATKDPRGVRRIIARLSGLLRYTLEGASEAEIPIARELEMLERYLEILEIRFRGRLETNVRVGPGVADALVPNLILQPLVENAMKHGISRSEKGGRIDVVVERIGEDILLSVADTGADGLGVSHDFGGDDEQEAPDERHGRSGGFGLRHTRERLQERYGPAGKLDLTRTEAGGTIASIRLPFHTRPAVCRGTPHDDGATAIDA